MFYYVKKFLLLSIIIILVISAIFLTYFSVQDIFATKAKQYIMNKYDFDKYDVFAYQVTEYQYDENDSCGYLLFKKCPSSEDLYKEIVFITKDGYKFDVTEYTNGTFEDNYKSDNN